VVVLAAIAALHLSGGALALSPDLTIKQLRHTAWGPSQGAPLGGAVALAQTNDGYLWIAGLSALFRFDGIAFERIELPHDPKLSSLRLYSAFAPRGGGLWVGFMFGGVAFLKAGHWQVFSVADGLPQGSPLDFAETPDGTLWVATSSDLARFDGARWKAVGSEMGLPAGDNSLVFVDSQGTIWADGGDRLFFLRPGEHQFRNQPVAAPTPWPARSMAESSTGTVWLDAGNDLVPVAENPPPGKPGRSFSGPVFDHDGALWDTWDGLRRIAHPEHPTLGAILHLKDIADAYTEADGLTAPSARAACADSEGNVWVGTTHGLDRFSEPRLKAPLQSAENLKVFPTITEPGVVPADDAGGLWVTDSDDAVVRYQDGRMSPPILRQDVESLLRVADGTVWFGGRKALWRERQGHLESVAPPAPDRYTQALAEDKSGGLWASILGSGVFRLKDGAWTPYGGIAALPRGTPITIVRDRRDRLWFSYPGGSVAVLDGEQVRTYGVADGLQIGNVMANHPGRIGHWLGGEFGLARFDGERFYSVQSAPNLPLDGITGIVETSDGDLWLNGGSGIVHLAATELERSRLDPAYRVHGETLGAFDGVVGSGAMLRPLPTAIEAGDGKLWFATTGGIYGIDPARRAHNRVPPPVLIRALTVSGHTIEPTPRLTLPVYTTAVSFDYVALSLTAPEKVRYRYRVDSIDTDWRALTASRQALYTNLRPGNYTFRVIAANNDGVWNEQGDSLAFSIPPAFIQTGWFLALCVAAGALAVWAVVRLRVRQVAAKVRGRMEAQLAERERIARELHDTLLQSFQGLLLRFQAVAKRLPEGSERQKLSSVIADASQAIGEGRNAIEHVRPPTAGKDLANALRDIGEELARNSGEGPTPALQVDVHGTPRTLHPIVRDEIYRIAREALHNAFQHAQAHRVEVGVRYDEHQLVVSVRDDGRGIDPEIIARGGRSGHFGLRGMRERSRIVGAHLDVWSERDLGTEVELSIPAAVAYAGSRSRAPFSWLSWISWKRATHKH
jgi:signal transduction histidine kinase/ligand-binding sensor domain-containing protein